MSRGGPRTEGLSARSQYLLKLIGDAVAAQAPAPRYVDLVDALQAAGFDMPPKVISWMVQDLRRRGLLLIEGPGGTQVYGIPGNPLRTLPPVRVRTEKFTAAQALAQARLIQSGEGWPRPTAESRAAYDATMVLGPPRRIVGRPDHERPMPRVTSVHVETRSLTGSAAEMCAV